MKTQTAEEFLKYKDEIDSLWTESDEDICKALGSPVLVAVSSWRVKFLVTFLISKVGGFTHYAHLSLHFALFAYCLMYI